MKYRILVLILTLLAIVGCKKETYYKLTVDCTPAEGGMTSESSGSYLAGTSVSIKATPSAEYLFSGWSGNASGESNPLNVIMDSDKKITANFVKKSYPLSTSVVGQGTVTEKVLSTKTDYQSGTEVQLTAIPDNHWLFDHWEGDLSGSENPSTVIVTSEKNIKAVFTKNSYAFNVKIVGPGVVDEYLEEQTKASLKYGTKVRLEAIPSEGAVFKGWSGDVNNSKSEIIVDVDGTKDIVATFGKVAHQYPKVDYMLPSVKQKCLYFGYDYGSLGLSNVNSYCSFDYNCDGYIDLVVSNTDWSYDGRFPIRFLLGNSDGEFSPDQKNDNRMMGLNNIRKIITGDYNGDGVVDYFLIGHGYDAEPWPGEYPVALLSNGDGTYSDSRLTELVSFYHGGASADFDNDGDLDVVLVDGGGGKEVVLINDGNGNFTPHEELVNHELLQGFYTADLFDINNDGYVDLISGLDDVNTWSTTIPFDNDYNNMSIVFWGNGKSYNTSNYTRLPKTPYYGMGLVLDYEFYDIDKDGADEIFLLRTGDGVFGENYRGWAVQIVKFNGRSFSDVTETFLSLADGYERDGNSIYWIDFEEIDGTVFMVGRRGATPHKMFELKSGKLVKLVDKSTAIQKPENGLHIYSDSSASDDKVDYGCNEDPYSGKTCVKISNWGMWTGFTIPLNPALENGTDLSYLKDNDYVLEFYIKNTNPSIEIHFKFNSLIFEEHSDDATYCYVYRGSEHRTDGIWERISIPLKSMDVWNTSEDFWEKIDNFNVIICSEGGEDFYLDEIRIRKVIE